MQETVLLDLDPLAVKSYNAFQAAIAVNAVDSERRDKARDFICQINLYLSIHLSGLSISFECEFSKLAYGRSYNDCLHLECRISETIGG